MNPDEAAGDEGGRDAGQRKEREDRVHPVEQHDHGQQRQDGREAPADRVERVGQVAALGPDPLHLVEVVGALVVLEPGDAGRGAHEVGVEVELGVLPQPHPQVERRVRRHPPHGGDDAHDDRSAGRLTRRVCQHAVGDPLEPQSEQRCGGELPERRDDDPDAAGSIGTDADPHHEREGAQPRGEARPRP